MKPRRFMLAMLAGSLFLNLGPSAGATTSGEQLWAVRSRLGYAARAAAVSPDGSKVFVAVANNPMYKTVAYEATTGAELWTSLYLGLGSDVRAIAVSPDGGTVFVTGESSTFAGYDNDTDYATVAYNSGSGALIWVARYRGPGRGTNRAINDARALAVSPDGSTVVVTGWSYGGGATQGDYATVAYNASSGARLWVSRYNGPTNGEDAATAVALSHDGSTVFVTGESQGTTGQSQGTIGKNYATVAYAARTGAELWVARFAGTGSRSSDTIQGFVSPSLGVTPDGSEVFITGGKAVAGGILNYATVAYDASTGEKLWARGYNGPGNGDDVAHSVVVSPDGSRVFVTGQSTGAGTHRYAFENLDYLTIAYDSSTGAELWLKRYNGPKGGEDAAYALAVSPDGSRVFITGASKGIGTGPTDYGTVAYTDAGAELWVGRYDDPAHRVDVALAIAVSPDGSKVFVVGQSTYAEYAVVAYAA